MKKITADVYSSFSNIICGPGFQFKVGSTQIVSTNLGDSSDLVRNTGNSLTINGQIQGNTLSVWNFADGLKML